MAEVFPAGISQKLVKNWILEPFVVRFWQILKYFQVWGFFQKDQLDIGLGGNGRKWVKNWILEPYLVKSRLVLVYFQV